MSVESPALQCVTFRAGKRTGTILHDVPDGGKWMGAPAQPDRQAKRQMIALHHLPELMRRVNELEKLVGRPPPSKPAE